MKACEGQVGRVFVIRLEHGNIVPKSTNVARVKNEESGFAPLEPWAKG